MATEFLVNDSHWIMRNLLIEQLDSRAKMIKGFHKPMCMLQGVDETRHRRVDAPPVVHARPLETCRVRDRRHVDQEVRRAAERRVQEHRVLDGLVRHHVRERAAVDRLLVDSRGRLAGVL